MRKKNLLTVLLIFIMTICSFGMSACFGNGGNGTGSSKYEFVGDLDMNVEYSEYLGYSVEIKGKLKNTSSREFSYASVTFAIYDAEGNQIETAMDNVNYVQPGSIWQFKASMIGWTDERPNSCKLVEVNAW